MRFPKKTVQKKYTYFIPLFSKISLLWGQQPGRDEASSNEGGENSGPTGHDFTDNLLYWLLPIKARIFYCV
jgi:hypothetical protein